MPPYIGEIRMFAGSFAPAGWLFCNGQLMPIAENDALFTLIGTTYGGDGEETFGLPNLQGRVPVHAGGPLNYILGGSAGVESVTLTTSQIPAHTHPILATSTPGNTGVPGATTILADLGPAGITHTPVHRAYTTANQVQLNANTVGIAGGSQPHDNMQPYLVVSYIISLFGIFPRQT